MSSKINREKHKKLKSLKKFSEQQQQQQSFNQLLDKIQLLPIFKGSKENLSKLIVTHKICEISKTLKVSKRSVTLQGKVNLKNRVFSKLESNDVVIKIYNNQQDVQYDFLALSAEKPMQVMKINFVSAWIYTNEKHFVDNLKIYSYKNIVVLKMFENMKTLPQIAQECPDKIDEIFYELFTLICELKKRHEQLWTEKVEVAKNIFWSNDKWFLMNVAKRNPEHNVEPRKSQFILSMIEFVQYFRNLGLRDVVLHTSTYFFHHPHRRFFKWDHELRKIINRKFFGNRLHYDWNKCPKNQKNIRK
jgi:hypothetical protein